jgi:predicted transcriptional regulator
MAREGSTTYFDRVYFGKCLQNAVKKKKMTYRQFQETYFSEIPISTVRGWLYGLAMPKTDSMQTLIDIFGWGRVRSWLRFTFDTTPKKQIS